MTIKKGRFWIKNNFGNIIILMIFGPKAWTVDNENDQKWSIGTPSQNLEFFKFDDFWPKSIKMTKHYNF